MFGWPLKKCVRSFLLLMWVSEAIDEPKRVQAPWGGSISGKFGNDVREGLSVGSAGSCKDSEDEVSGRLLKCWRATGVGVDGGVEVAFELLEDPLIGKGAVRLWASSVRLYCHPPFHEGVVVFACLWLSSKLRITELMPMHGGSRMSISVC
jgi:hypothetical protein